MKFEELNPVLQAEIEKAEEIAIGYIHSNIKYSLFISFGNTHLKKIIADTLDEAIDAAVDEIENLEEETVVLVFHELIRLNDTNLDGIVSQVYNIDEDTGYSFCLLYKIQEGKIEFLKNRVFLGEIRNCLIF
ncbi:hypothetical protein [Chryseobacterium sp. Marseille-Q3244]|uniref:hypothetical protein n=1 Tax=Chryseobacterium sp. Marseille-Q3244 TaxID=2758092 RepID=UPI0020241F9C|nr:hypothetical protein [Chryseobacterium sp. Marseille-Q3244]